MFNKMFDIINDRHLRWISCKAFQLCRHPDTKVRIQKLNQTNFQFRSCSCSHTFLRTSLLRAPSLFLPEQTVTQFRISTSNQFSFLLPHEHTQMHKEESCWLGRRIPRLGKLVGFSGQTERWLKKKKSQVWPTCEQGGGWVQIHVSI